MRNARGEAPRRSNPVFTIARKVDECEPLLEWVDYVLIATFDLVNHPENALTKSVSLFSEVFPTTLGDRIINGKQNMTLRVVDTTVQPTIETNCVEMSRNERKMMLQQGKPAAEVNKLIWANFQWQPSFLPFYLHFRRIITPEKIEAFKSLTPPAIPPQVSRFKPNARSAKYIEYLNYQLRLPEYADIATTNVVVSDFLDTQDRNRSLATAALQNVRRTGKF